MNIDFHIKTKSLISNCSESKIFVFTVFDKINDIRLNKIEYILRAEKRHFHDSGLFSREFMPSKKVSGKFAKVIFVKTRLLTKIAKVFSQF